MTGQIELDLEEKSWSASRNRTNDNLKFDLAENNAAAWTRFTNFAVKSNPSGFFRVQFLRCFLNPYIYQQETSEQSCLQTGLQAKLVHASPSFNFHSSTGQTSIIFTHHTNVQPTCCLPVKFCICSNTSIAHHLLEVQRGMPMSARFQYVEFPASLMNPRVASIGFDFQSMTPAWRFSSVYIYEPPSCARSTFAFLLSIASFPPFLPYIYIHQSMKIVALSTSSSQSA